MHIVYFRQLAQYNAWANWRVYEACAQLSDAERKATRPCFFGSIHRTLNHILVGDRALAVAPDGGRERISPASTRNSTAISPSCAPLGSGRMSG